MKSDKMRLTTRDRLVLFLLLIGPILAFGPLPAVRRCFLSGHSKYKIAGISKPLSADTEMRAHLSTTLPAADASWKKQDEVAIVDNSVARNIYTIVTALVFLNTPLANLFFAVLQTLAALALMMPLFFWLAFPVWQAFRVVEGSCPRCHDTVRVMKQKGRCCCPHCGEAVELNQFGKLVPAGVEKYAAAHSTAPSSSPTSAFAADLARRRREFYESNGYRKPAFATTNQRVGEEKHNHQTPASSKSEDFVTFTSKRWNGVAGSGSKSDAFGSSFTERWNGQRHAPASEPEAFVSTKKHWNGRPSFRSYSVQREAFEAETTSFQDDGGRRNSGAPAVIDVVAVEDHSFRDDRKSWFGWWW